MFFSFLSDGDTAIEAACDVRIIVICQLFECRVNFSIFYFFRLLLKIMYLLPQFMIIKPKLTLECLIGQML